jgi:hypothetical protein
MLVLFKTAKRLLVAGDVVLEIDVMKSYSFVILVVSGLVPLAGCSSSSHDMSKLKEELKQEILAELRQQERTAALASPQQDREQMKEEIEQEVLTKVQNQVQAMTSQLRDANDTAIQWQRVPVGSAEGGILRGGEGLQGCQVKLVRIMKPQSVFEMFNTIREGTEFVTVTGDDGKYVFDGLPVGSYKLKWQLPGDKGWIRRLRDRPDAIITEGQVTILKSVETKRRLVGR